MSEKLPPTKISPLEEQVLKATKEIVVKFIEIGRVSPSNFAEVFQNIYQTVESSVKDAGLPPRLIDAEQPDKDLDKCPQDSGSFFTQAFRKKSKDT